MGGDSDRTLCDLLFALEITSSSLLDCLYIYINFYIFLIYDILLQSDGERRAPHMGGDSDRTH